MQIDKVLSRLEAVKNVGNGKWIAKCPAHPDKRPSLSIKLTQDRILLHCFAGCSIEKILNALGMHEKELFMTQKNSAAPGRRRRDVQKLAAQALMKAYVRIVENELGFEIRLARKILNCGGWQKIFQGGPEADALAWLAHRVDYLEYLYVELIKNPKNEEILEKVKEVLCL